jgi:hypothetical protein
MKSTDERESVEQDTRFGKPAQALEIEVLRS